MISLPLTAGVPARDRVELPAVVDCVDRRLYNSVAAQGASFPFAVYQVIPLEDNYGQARTSIESVFLIDFKIYSRLPLPFQVDEAVAAAKEHFRASETFQTDNFRISIRHDRLISLAQKGAKVDERIIVRGSSYRAWVS